MKRRSTKEQKQSKRQKQDSPSGMDLLNQLEQELDAEQAMKELDALEKELSLSESVKPRSAEKRQSLRESKPSLQALLEKDKQDHLSPPVVLPNQTATTPMASGNNSYHRTGNFSLLVPQKSYQNAANTASTTPLYATKTETRSSPQNDFDAQADLDLLLEETIGRSSKRLENNPMSKRHRTNEQLKNISPIHPTKVQLKSIKPDLSKFDTMTNVDLLNHLIGGTWTLTYDKEHKVNSRPIYLLVSIDCKTKAELIRLKKFCDPSDVHDSYPFNEDIIGKKLKKGSPCIAIPETAIQREKLLELVKKNASRQTQQGML